MSDSPSYGSRHCAKHCGLVVMNAWLDDGDGGFVLVGMEIGNVFNEQTRNVVSDLSACPPEKL